MFRSKYVGVPDLAEHVAKTIAVCRKNFLFAATEDGARASGRVFSLIETARTNGHNPQQYLSVLLTELPALGTFDEIDQLLPWTISPAEIAARYKGYPCLLYTSPSPRDATLSRMPSSA